MFPPFSRWLKDSSIVHDPIGLIPNDPDGRSSRILFSPHGWLCIQTSWRLWKWDVLLSRVEHIASVNSNGVCGGFCLSRTAGKGGKKLIRFPIRYQKLNRRKKREKRFFFTMSFIQLSQQCHHLEKSQPESRWVSFFVVSFSRTELRCLFESTIMSFFDRPFSLQINPSSFVIFLCAKTKTISEKQKNSKKRMKLCESIVFKP